MEPGNALLWPLDWDNLRNWYQANGRHWLPWRDVHDPWKIFIAETLLHRTRAAAAKVVFTKVDEEFDSPEKVVAGGERWLALTRQLGLSWRALSFIRACENLIEEHGSQIPKDRFSLIALPGVGHYTAGAIQCFGFGVPTALVDANTIRIAGRLAGVSLNPRRHRSREVQRFVARLGPGGSPPTASDNLALLDLAAAICLPRTPICDKCPVQPRCSTGSGERRSRITRTSIPDIGL